jgi:hypothetical protein
MSKSPKIPFCQSEFLQDFTIALGVLVSGTKHGWRSFNAEVDTCEHEQEKLERLTIWVTTYYFTRINLTLWEDKTLWVSVALLPTKNNGEYEIGFYPKFESLGFKAIIDALINTISISTRLCYSESPLPLLRQIWKHRGKVNITGELKKTPKTTTNKK